MTIVDILEAHDDPDHPLRVYLSDMLPTDGSYYNARAEILRRGWTSDADDGWRLWQHPYIEGELPFFRACELEMGLD